jgi:hypothetical protein
MSYLFEITEVGEYIKVVISGEYIAGSELEDNVNLWGNVLKSCQGKDSRRILAIWKIPGYLPTMAAYNLAETADQQGWIKDFKIAIVYLDQERYQDGLMAETFAAEHGYDVRMFLDENDAKKWLMEKS